MAEGPLVVLAAGGTGGHLFPAEALAVALGKRGVQIDLATDERATRYGSKFPARETHIIPSGTPRGRDLAAGALALFHIGQGLRAAYKLFADLKPAAVVGFGGYPTIPPIGAAVIKGIPTIIHEQNGVMGRGNRVLAPFVTAIALSFPHVLEEHRRLAAKATRTGNPVRPAVIEAAKIPYPSAAGGPFRIVAFGGSQGARVMADVVPAAVELVPVAVRARLVVVQQARDEDIPRVRDIYRRLGVNAEVEPFFGDLPARMAASHLVVARSGASTVAELATLGRPGILVPLPHALDQDQLANAAMLERAGGAIRIDQSAFTPKRLAAEIAQLAAEPKRLTAIAEAARLCGAPDAADRLADLVLQKAGLSG